jgi:hypothetical protein
MKNVFLILNIIFIVIEKSHAQMDRFYHIIQETIMPTLNDTLTELPLSDQCRDMMKSTYLNTTYFNYFLTKFIHDSSKNKQDVGSFYDCNNNNVLLDMKFSYYILDVFRGRENKTRSDYKDDFYVYGLCVVTGCGVKELESIVFTLNEKLDDPLDFQSKKEFLIYDTFNNKVTKDYLFFLNLIPLYLVLLTMFVMVFPKVPAYLFKCCFREKVNVNIKLTRYSSGDLTGISSSLNDYNEDGLTGSMMGLRSTINKKKLHKFSKMFNYKSNFEELMNRDSTLYNFSGLSYVKGIQATCTYLFLFGNLYFLLFNSPLKGYNEAKFIKFQRCWYNCIIFFGIRYSPRIFFSVSGYTLVYKLYCYLDEFKPVTYRDFFRFFFKQSYRCLYFMLFVVFFKYTFIPLSSSLIQTGPLWLYLKINVVDALSFYELFGYFYLYSSELECHVFWLPINEVFFFIVSSFLLFLGYRHKIRTDIIFICFFIIFFIGRHIVVYYIMDDVYPTLYQFSEDYGRYSTNPLFNYTYYMIGIFFGTSNYIIQKSITGKTIRDEDRMYLSLHVKFVKMHRNKKAWFVNLATLGGSLLILVLSNISLIFFYILGAGEHDHFQSYNENPILNFILLVDTDIVIFVFHFVCFLMFINGNPVFRALFESKLHNHPARMYFVMICVINPITLYIFYQSENIIALEMFNILFFTTVSSVLLNFGCLFCGIFFEIPWKRLNKYILTPS